VNTSADYFRDLIGAGEVTEEALRAGVRCDGHIVLGICSIGDVKRSFSQSERKGAGACIQISK